MFSGYTASEAWFRWGPREQEGDVMSARIRAPGEYTDAERRLDAAIHVAGVASALVAAPTLITLAALWFGDATIVAAAVIYGLSLLAMLSCSALYNMARLPAWNDAFRRIDQSAIYFKIAGTYTPFAVLTGGHAGWFLTGLWGAALAGISLLHLRRHGPRWPTLALYLGIGWAGVVFGQQVFAGLTPLTFNLIVAGGLIYTGGVVFFVWDRLPYHYAIWHAFVLTATLILYAAVLAELWSRAPA
jgi:hemolysin III